MKSCNQCHREMNKDLHINWRVCTYPDCPNYALLQIAAEDMPKEIGLRMALECLEEYVNNEMELKDIDGVRKSYRKKTENYMTEKQCPDCLAHYEGEHICPPWLKALVQNKTAWQTLCKKCLGVNGWHEGECIKDGRLTN